jgi:lipoyl-dependent peroxiredoxin
MATTRRATTLHEKSSWPRAAGRLRFESSGLGPFEVVAASEPEGPAGSTSPMELLAAAYASCLELTVALLLSRCGHRCDELSVSAEVTFEVADREISGIHAIVNGVVPGLTLDELILIVDRAKDHCPVGKALAGTKLTLDVELH